MQHQRRFTICVQRVSHNRASDLAIAGLHRKLKSADFGIETAVFFALMAKAARNQVWWLESGRERCSKCGHQYVYETGYYCEGCDGPLCSICVETFTASVVCVRCEDSEKGEP